MGRTKEQNKQYMAAWREKQREAETRRKAEFEELETKAALVEQLMVDVEFIKREYQQLLDQGRQLYRELEKERHYNQQLLEMRPPSPVIHHATPVSPPRPCRADGITKRKLKSRRIKRSKISRPENRDVETQVFVTPDPKCS